MKVFTSKRQRIGMVGEKIAAQYLLDKGFCIIETNYTKKIGEIDIVATKQEILHFVEVKTLLKHVSYETVQDVTHETLKRSAVSKKLPDEYSPFENVSRSKMKKFSRTCEWYLGERRVSHETRWQIDAIAVTISRETRSAKVEVMWNIIS